MFAVCHQQVEDFIWLCRSQLGATYCSGVRLGVKQMGRFSARSLYVCLESSFTGCIYSLKSFFFFLLLSAFMFSQCDGIPLGKMKTISTNRRLVMHSIIIFKFLSIVHSSRPPTNLHLFLSLLWLFARTLRDRVAILLRFSDKELVSLHYIPMSVEILLLDDVYANILFGIDGDIYFWYCTTPQYLGRKTVRIIDRSCQGDEGRAQMHEDIKGCRAKMALHGETLVCLFQILCILKLEFTISPYLSSGTSSVN